MIALEGTLATVRFEFQRSLTAGRIAAFAILTLFPPSITIIAALTPGSIELWIPVSITTLVVCLLSNLLWATPMVSNELEGKTWIYGCSRPGGRIAMLLGKYVISVFWTLAVCWLAVTLSVMVISVATPYLDEVKIFLVLLGVTALATIGYAATFSLIGILFHRRSMMVAMGYCLVSEIALASIPALIGKLTIRSHLTHILAYSLGPPEFTSSSEFILMFGEPALILRSFAIILIAMVALAAGMIIIRYREFMTADES